MKILAQTCRALRMSATDTKNLRNPAGTCRALRVSLTRTRNLGTCGEEHEEEHKDDLAEELEEGLAGEPAGEHDEELKGELSDAAEVGELLLLLPQPGASTRILCNYRILEDIDNHSHTINSLQNSLA